MKSVLQALLLTVLSTAAFPHVAAAGEESVSIHDAWVRAMPAAARALPLYFTLHNHSDTEMTLTGISLDGATNASVELHQTLQQGEMMKMVPVEHITVAAGAMTALEPMGLHAMILGLSPVPVAGDILNFSATFADGSTGFIKAEVRNASGSDADQSGHQH